MGWNKSVQGTWHFISQAENRPVSVGLPGRQATGAGAFRLAVG